MREWVSERVSERASVCVCEFVSERVSVFLGACVRVCPSVDISACVPRTGGRLDDGADAPVAVLSH